MSFGQQSGPPATAKQLAYLEQLLQQAGYATFRDARHPLDLTQRQSSGKFTRQEASELIDRLAGAEPVADDTPPDAPPTTSRRAATPTRETSAAAAAPRVPSTARERRDADRLELVRGLPDQLLADELTRRGWTVTEP